MPADTRTGPLRLLLLAAALLGWTGLALRLWLTLATFPDALPAAIGYLSFFTIQSDILAALVLSAWALRPAGGSWLHRPGVRAAALVYLAVVGMVYAVLLRSLWNLRGLAWFCDVVLHDVMPVLYVLCWLAAAPKGLLTWRQAPWWLLFPAGYLVYSLARGLLTGTYPYPFIDMADLGYGGVAVNAVVLLAVFWALSLLVVATDRALARRATPESA